ncbi:hypothetical protein J559_1036 [Acinetobacter sp. 983759]|nr:hypothetical protein J546_0047 [Acinetobacter sp. 1461402]EXB73348.1 hypothetical protein J550_0609 [Acinetobacter sp. 230853]EXC33029.1 hypothetical protein J520_1257 [Acinetobacter sp. 869535]EXE15035.1 hypothetical protein J559_1036 [Acinetobacter sp. 983759]
MKHRGMKLIFKPEYLLFLPRTYIQYCLKTAVQQPENTLL